MPSKVPSVDPSSRHKWEVERKFEQAVEETGDRWKADTNEVYDYMAACESIAEKLFLIDLAKEAGTHLEHISTSWDRADGWYLTVSAPFAIWQGVGAAPWFRIYPQRPILMPDGLLDRRDARRASSGDLYCRVDFLAAVHVEACNTETAGDSELPQPVVIEIDGKGNHSGRQQIRRDYTRNHKFQNIGVPVYRYLASDVNDSEYNTGAKVFSDLWTQAQQTARQIR